MRTVIRFAATVWFVMGSLSIICGVALGQGVSAASTVAMCLLAVVITISHITDTGGSKEDQHRWWMRQI